MDAPNTARRQVSEGYMINFKCLVVFILKNSF